MLNVSIPPEALAPIIDQVVTAVIERLRKTDAKAGDQIAYCEPEAAAMIGLKQHQLRDERLRGRIGASGVVGKGIRYLRSDLDNYLARERFEVRI